MYIIFQVRQLGGSWQVRENVSLFVVCLCSLTWQRCLQEGGILVGKQPL